MKEVTKDMLIGDILRQDRSVAPILMEMGMHCLGCPSAQVESLEDACRVHGVEVNEIVEKMNAFLAEKA